MKKILVCSGKGGVGKSTISVLLSLFYASQGKTILLDCDITGASIPHYLGLNERMKVENLDSRNYLIPVSVNPNLGVVSIDLIQHDSTVAWRGPMITSAIRQLFGNTLMEDIKFLIADAPPGTSDAVITLLEETQWDLVVIVKQDTLISEKIAGETKSLIQKHGFPILEVINNSKVEGSNRIMNDDNMSKLFDSGRAIEVDFKKALLNISFLF
ncbi:Iron-sulfur cluster carrier protein [uncultured archaeon]|nr:Iron-sulfur cluster carrier protein [uncultured archaeon]